MKLKVLKLLALGMSEKGLSKHVVSKENTNATKRECGCQGAEVPLDREHWVVVYEILNNAKCRMLQIKTLQMVEGLSIGVIYLISSYRGNCISVKYVSKTKILQEDTSEILATANHRVLFSLRRLFFYNERKGVDPEWRGLGRWRGGQSAIGIFSMREESTFFFLKRVFSPFQII